MSVADVAYVAVALAALAWAVPRIAAGAAEVLEYRAYRRSYPAGHSWPRWRRLHR